MAWLAGTSGQRLLLGYEKGQGEMRTRTAVILAVALMVVLSSCGDDNTGTRGPNLPPDTEIVSGPDSGSTASYLAEIHWRGLDDDGRVEGFEFAWLKGAISYHDADTTGLIDWQYTTQTESTFAVSADSATGQGLYSRKNTFFLRAIDNDGAVDPEPARLTYTATTVPPRARITYPTAPGQTSTSQPRCVTIRWEGLDDDGEAVSYRWTVKPYGDWPGPGQPYPQWDRTHWTPWSSDTEGVVPLNQDEAIYTWSFFVQARDNAGATETTFEPGRNYIVIQIDPTKESKPWVELCVYSGSCLESGSEIACRSSGNPSGMSVPVYLDVGDTVCFRATFLPGTYATYVDGIAFLVNDPEPPYYMEDASNPSNRHYPPLGDPAFIVGQGIFSIHVWVRDDYCEYGSTNHAYIEIIGD
jgi:hypothetical protein